jgi:inositol-1,3,4-trisphosphate 5/6-kinase/inositol-tetrakisphosphate 1-kinase
MSRADIANTLEWCLIGVSSASGIPVGSPTSAVIAPPFSNHPDDLYQISDSALIDTSWLDNKVSHLSYPIIVKPLCAAGTKASHAMAVIMNPASLHRVVTDKAPCILQEYINHDAFLYKVYVLGDHVSVHKRRSLPNLPFRSVQSELDHVEFDSQRPYPRLSDFGYPEDLTTDVCDGCSHRQYNNEISGNKIIPISENIPDEANKNDTIVTVDEIMPIVNALRVAFGLQLFGFDVLITSNCSCNDKRSTSSTTSSTDATKKRMLVIDVNYFPSYKEVTNFPALLAKYLTDRVLESRKKSLQKI